MNHGALETLFEAARLAPSGDNTQPWRFEISPHERTLQLILVPERDLSPMNAGQNMARIALGAALENVLQTAEFNGWQCDYQCDLKSVEVRLQIDYEAGQVPSHIKIRGSNRKKYDRCELEVTTGASLKESMQGFNADVLWITSKQERQQLCELIAEADSIILSAQQVRNAFLEKVRFDQPVTAIVEEGLSIGSLELAWTEQQALRALKFVPDWLLAICGGRSLFRKAANKLATSASGFCVITSTLGSSEREYDLGRKMQRAWLAATRLGLAVQPMMSLPVLRNIVENLPSNSNPINAQVQAIDLLGRFDQFIASSLGAQSFAGAILRFGYAEKATVVTGRLPAAQLCSTRKVDRVRAEPLA